MRASAGTSERVALHVVTRGELADERYPARWDDPDGIARMGASKRRALLANPLAGGDDEPVQIVAARGARPVGRLDLVAGRIRVGAEETPCLWGSALYVPEELRHTLAGVKLVLKQQSLHHTVASCGISRQAYPIYQKLGWLDIAMRRYVLVRRSRAVLERYVDDILRRVGAPLARRLRVVVDCVLLVQRGLLAGLRAVRARGLACAQVDSLPACMDELLVRSERPVSPHRSTAWVRWLAHHRFHDDPRDRSGIFLVHGGDGDPVAYFLLKARFYDHAGGGRFRNLYRGSLQDWAVFRPEAVGLAELVLLSTDVLGDWNTDAVEVCLPPDASGLRLARLGFAAAGELHLMVKASAASPLADPAYREPGSWRVRPAEGDNFFF